MAGYRMIWRALGGDTLELTLVTSQVPPSAYRAIPPDDAHPRITISRVWAGSFDSGIPRCTLARRPFLVVSVRWRGWSCRLRLPSRGSRTIKTGPGGDRTGWGCCCGAGYSGT